MEKRYTARDEAFYKRLTAPAEECLRRGLLKPAGGYRWFRSPNITPLEHYRRRDEVAKPRPPLRAA